MRSKVLSVGMNQPEIGTALPCMIRVAAVVGGWHLDLPSANVYPAASSAIALIVSFQLLAVGRGLRVAAFRGRFDEPDRVARRAGRRDAECNAGWALTWRRDGRVRAAAR